MTSFRIATGTFGVAAALACAPIIAQGERSPLAGTAWQLVKFTGGDDTTLTPPTPTRYTIAFGDDGRMAVRLDCNRGSGTWKSDGKATLEFGPLALTRAMCPPGSLHDQIARQWTYVRSYVRKDGRLFLSLMADGGIYEFAPLAPGPASPVTSKGPATFDCTPKEGGAASSLVVTFFDTRPALALLESGGETRPAFQVRAASGAKYEGAGVSFWETRGEATVHWNGSDLTCKRR